MVYFVQSVHEGPVKIGYTQDIRKRMSTLRTGHPEHLILLGVMEGDRAEESRIKELFKASKKQGEWFYPSPALFEFIRLNVDEELRPLPNGLD